MSDTPTDDRSLTIQQFCALEALSPASYFKLRRLGKGPREMRIAGSSFVRISAAARFEWQERMHAPAEKDAKRLAQESEARSTRASLAGKAGARSPDHPCRKRQRRGGR